MSSRSWLSYSYQSRFHLTPLSYETLEYASGFASEQCPEGIVAISTNTLRYGYTLQWRDMVVFSFSSAVCYVSLNILESLSSGKVGHVE